MFLGVSFIKFHLPLSAQCLSDCLIRKVSQVNLSKQSTALAQKLMPNCSPHVHLSNHL